MYTLITETLYTFDGYFGFGFIQVVLDYLLGLDFNLNIIIFHYKKSLRVHIYIHQLT